MDSETGNAAAHWYRDNVDTDLSLGENRAWISIHNSVRPQGCLLAFNVNTHNLQRVSWNATGFLALHSLKRGMRLEVALGAEAALAIFRAVTESIATGRPSLIFALSLGERRDVFDLAVHTSGDEIIVECVRSAQKGVNGGLICFLRSAIDRLREKTDLQLLVTEAVTQLRLMTGYDHVMLYRFAHDGLAEVLADSCHPEVNSLAGQFMSEEDLTQKAREAYRQSLIRLIEDVDATPVPVLSDKDLPELDTSRVMLKAVSPETQDYLRRCGVRGTMLLALVVDDALWGMLVCRHHSPKNITMDERAVAKMLGEYVALQITAIVRLNRLQTSQRSNAFIENFVQKNTSFADVPDYVRGHVDSLASLVPCDGVAVWLEGVYAGHGLQPGNDEAVAKLVEWSRASTGGIAHTWKTVCLQKDAPELMPYLAGIAGMIVIPLTPQPGDYLYFFRKETVRIINYAPENGSTSRTSSRQNIFRKEEMHNCSLAWTIGDEEAAESLKVALIEATGMYRQLQLEQKAEAEVRQRLLNEELTHRVKNILSVVQSVVTRTIADESAQQECLRRLKDRIGALAIAHDQIVGVNAGGRLSSLLQAELAPYATHPHAVTTTGPDLWLSGKALSVMTLLFHELATNAAKYGALSCDKGHLDIRWHFDPEQQVWNLTWQESGGPPAHEPVRCGFGTVLLDRALKHELGGASQRKFHFEGLQIDLALPGRYIKKISDHEDVQWEAPARLADEQGGDEAANNLLLQEAQILIVEDQILIAMEAEDTLTNGGVGGVHTAASVDEARDMIDDCSVSAAILDINLGDENAMELATLLCERQIPFIFTTGYTSPSMIPAEFSAVPIVQKPYSSAALIKSLKAVMA